jgi:uncharacterized protein YbjT (DUF2867 family)
MEERPCHINLQIARKRIEKSVADDPVRREIPRSDQREGTESVFLVTSVGANANSRSFYVRTKGETERDIIALGFEHTHLFRPSMLMGHRKENRPMEKMMIRIWSVINPIFFGKLNSLRGIDGKDVAEAMSNAAKYPTEKVKIYHWKDMRICHSKITRGR